MAKVLALCNQKGGVGKTTTTYHLARAAVLAGKRVLGVDLDPQGSFTTVATPEGIAADDVSLADVLSPRGQESIRNVTVPGLWPGLDVVPTAAEGETLGAVGQELVSVAAGRESRLRGALENVQGDYDLILIDCPPSLDQLTINGLVAADAVGIVTQTKLLSINGLAKLLTTIEAVKSHYNPELVLAGIIINQHEAHTTAGRHWQEELAEAAKGRFLPILDPPVPKRAAISDAPEAARGLDEWGNGAAGSLAGIYADHLSALEGALR